MNKQELINEINKTREHLANMEKMLEECEYERWKPEEGELYYYVDTFGEVCEWLFFSTTILILLVITLTTAFKQKSKPNQKLIRFWLDVCLKILPES